MQIYRIPSYRKRGFTLIELMITVAIIAILAVVVSNIQFSRITDKERRDRIAGSLSSAIRSARMTSISGRGMTQGANTCFDAAIEFRKDMANGSFVQIASDGKSIATNCGGNEDYSMNSLFSSGSGYTLSRISGSNTAGVEQFCIGEAAECWSITSASKVQLLFKGGTITAVPYDSWNTAFTDAIQKSLISLRFHVAYHEAPGNHQETQSRDVVLDLRTGKMDIISPLP